MQCGLGLSCSMLWLTVGIKHTNLPRRANRIVDALAKLSALQAQLLPEALKLIISSEAAVRYAAKLLGRTTHAANHHVTVVTDENGKECNKILRDAMPAPQRPKRRLSPKGAKAAPVPTATCLPSDSSSSSSSRVVLPPPLKTAKLGRKPPKRKQLAEQVEAERLNRRVEEIGSSLSTSAGRISASDRLAALKQRKGIAPISAL